MTLRNPRALIGIAFAVPCLIVLFVHRPPYDLAKNVYSDRVAPARLLEGLKFRDVSAAYGLVFHHAPPRPAEGDHEVPITTLSVPSPSVSVIDINGDGYMDVFIAGSPNKLFINDQGHGFHEAAREYGIDSPETDAQNSFGLFADFNGDGKLDLLLARWPCHKLYYGAGPGHKFVDRTELLGGYCSWPEAVGALDFNRDGRLDLAFANLLGKPDEKPESFPYWFSAPRYDDKTGAATDLLLQEKDGSFKWQREISFQHRPYSHALGISDVNEDGWPDLFVANDYSSDQMYLNVQGHDVRDITEKSIPRRYHGLTGMNAEFADVNQDGHMDLFVSNAYKPPFLKSINLLWIKNPVTHAFVNESVQRGVDRCGFAWGAKFADFNNDGRLDLAVANGRERGSKVRADGQGHSFWYERTVISQIPLFLRRSYMSGTIYPFSELYTSAFERDCLFMQDEDGQFYDVADATDIGRDMQEGRGLALIDIDNDGKMDFVVVNLYGDLRLWHNESTLSGHWIGFTLRDKTGGTVPFGAFARLVRDDAPDLVVEYYPTNGYRAQSDPRLHFGLGQKTKLKYLEVHWPDHQVTRYANLRLDAYQVIEQRGRD